jgi:hypothetical protein
LRATIREEHPDPGDFCVAPGNVVAPVYVDTNDYAGVILAADNLCADINRVASVCLSNITMTSSS